MVLRTVVGAVAGLLAGSGFLLTLYTSSEYCNGGSGRAGCGAVFPLTFGLIFSVWMVLAAALVYAGFRVTREKRWWWAAGIGSALWFVLFVGVIYVRFFRMHGMYRDDVDRFLVSAYLITACVGYAVGALCTGRRRTS
ncbi:hypothetical protein [Lentzea aerocolonigenes]|uniref:hypothetical protein n=1 Tax=Lentzea aerocolonigenes TaxID=68170 RepID=UPI0004C3A89F|nr:hypothetical protein [Lentzea aerocolonigenes]MCP2250280.1 hypothetical protein [Lentzea aerocolonigenes]